MNKVLKIIATICVLAVVAGLVYVAGESALSGAPLVALVPVGVVLFAIVAYIRFTDKQD